MTVREVREIETCDDLVLSPIHRRPTPLANPPSGLSREDAVVVAWLEQVGKECRRCGNPMDYLRHGRRPTLTLVDPAKRATLDNVVVRCARCAEED